MAILLLEAALVAGAVALIFLLLLATGRALWVQGLTQKPQVLQSAHAFARVCLWAVLVPALAALAGFGVVLGVLAERWVREPGTLFDLLRRSAEGAARRLDARGSLP